MTLKTRCGRALVAALALCLTPALIDTTDAQTTKGKGDGKKPTTTSKPKGGGKPAPEILDLDWFRVKPNKAWTTMPLSSAMRKASFSLPSPKKDGPTGELTLFYFGKGQGGSAEMNIQRWKGMFAKPADVSQEDFAKRKDRVIDGLKVTLLEVKGSYLGASFQREKTPKHNHMMFAAVVETGGGNYYFRALGPAETLEHWKKYWYEMMTGLKAGKGKKKATTRRR